MHLLPRQWIMLTSGVYIHYNAGIYRQCMQLLSLDVIRRRLNGAKMYKTGVWPYPEYHEYAIQQYLSKPSWVVV